MTLKILMSVYVLTVAFHSLAQSITPTPGLLKLYTADWNGERFADGRLRIAEHYANNWAINSGNFSPSAILLTAF